MAGAVQGDLCTEPFPPSELTDQWRCALKSLRSFPKLVVFLLAALGCRALDAQTLVISPNPLNITVQANTSTTAQLSFASSSTTTPVYFTITPSSAATWLHTSLGTGLGTTPQTVAITIDPLPASATPFTGSL